MAKIFELINDQQKYKELLDVISNTLDYTPQHQLTIYEQFPKAKQLATMEQWNACGRRVLRGRRAIRLNSGNRAIYLFDISQTYVNNNASQREAHWSYNKEYNALYSQVLCNAYDVAYNGEELELCIDKVINNILNITEDNNRATQLRNFAKESAEYVTLSRLGIDISSHIFDFSMFSSLSEKEFASVITTANSLSRSLLKYAQDVMENSQEYVNKLNEEKAENIEHKQEEHSIQFGLFGNGITAYDVSRIDKETNDYPTVAHISSEGVITTYDDNISAEDMERIKSQAEYARKSFMDEWNKLSVEQQYQRLLDRADVATLTNISSEPRGTLSSQAQMKYVIEKYMPFIFFKEGERPKPNSLKEKESSQDKPTVQDITFIGNDTDSDIVESKFGADFMQELHKSSVADLEVGDIIMYNGSRREVESINNKSISLKDLDAPDFGGVLNGTSEVLAYDGWQEDMEHKGFEIISKSAKDEHNIDLMSDAEEVEKDPLFNNTELKTTDYKVVMLREVGDFYEMYGDSAKIGAKVLGLHMLSKNGEPMVGFPDKAKDKYLKKLRDAGYNVLAEKVFELYPPKGKDNEQFQFQQTNSDTGNQLSLFGNEPEKKEKKQKPKSEFASGPFVDGVQVYEALAAEIDRGTGFVDGKLRVQEYYENNHPRINQLADFLKKEYGVGGHSGEGKISFVDYNSKGITFSFENGEKFRHSWFNVAVMTEARIKADIYLSDEQKLKRAVLNEGKDNLRRGKIEVGDRFRNIISGEVNDVVALEDTLPLSAEDCTVKRQYGTSEITENISYKKLLYSGLYWYIGNVRSKEEKEPAAVPVYQSDEIDSVKNLSQLKKAIKPGMMFEITDHMRSECIGEHRIVTGVNTVDFTSKKLNENGEPTGKDIHMNFGHAKDWIFDDDEFTSKLENGATLMGFHFIDSLEREKISVQTEETANSDDDEILDLTAQDENVRR